MFRTVYVFLGVVWSTAVLATGPLDRIRAPSISVFPGEEDVLHPVLATNAAPLQGFQLAAAYDSMTIDLEDVTLENTITEAFQPDFLFLEVDSQAPQPYFVFAVILEVGPPHDGTTIPPGQDQIFAVLRYDIPATIPVGTRTFIEFRNLEFGDPVINNIFTVGGLTRLPFLEGGHVTVVPPQPRFLRGDADRDGTPALGDVLFVLEYLFLGGAAPTCPDSADFTDDGAVNLFDPIGIATFLFSGGKAPPYPYPGVGLDPTEDGLEVCNP